MAEDRALIVSEATALAEGGHFGQSLALIENARVAAPDDPELIFARASTLFAWGRLHEAREAAARAEALGLQHVALYLQLGWSCYRIGNMGEAEAWMRKAVAAEPAGWEPHLNLAVVLVAQKRPAEAAASYERALALHPNDFDCLMGLANCCVEQRDPIGAEKLLWRAIAVNGESPAAWGQLGVALGRQDRDQDGSMTCSTTSLGGRPSAMLAPRLLHWGQHRQVPNVGESFS
jgi:Flp pilus assembly protein TadD